nr:Chain C, HLA class II histocompatibility antigen, gamma chain [Homo sapiens]3QXA_C Chain C, HLA class II histocompatibility antigen gamma chain peptide [Homo sapiens]3QXA_F Chain F, HLA class II histocompatibility antigen gamma chain peptide [Homo sapiens]3QXD_C Chain C, HLA class II histocompatibility antigen gamma chain peptide [Homo sapiens]3QXD_F Chain F, HLA class II histocompatibility antigen gamma chain peptide [Homo sapiens]5KSU_C Chain C, HLA class II histocompatibility antigen gam
PVSKMRMATPLLMQA